jgi:uncharacterized membrane protein YebE (DUF533 family)
MFNADRLLSDLIGGGLSGGVLGGRRSRYRGRHGIGDAVGRTIMSPQGLTILGGLAIAAYEHYKEKSAAAAGQPGASAPLPPSATAGPGAAPAQSADGGPASSLLPPPFVPPATPAGEERARLLIIAMVSAAKADGTIDPDERSRILGRLAERGASDAERAFLEEELARPLDTDRLVAQAGDPVLAAEIYAASRFAIDPDTPAEEAYLATLASRLNLDPGMVRELESRIDAAGA